MSFTYVLHPKAQEEYEMSVKWYFERSPQAAKNFVKAVDYTLLLICASPTRWRNEYKHYYELGLKKYPFTIVYSIDSSSQKVVILAIHHSKRNPKKKYRK